MRDFLSGVVDDLAPKGGWRVGDRTGDHVHGDACSQVGRCAGQLHNRGGPAGNDKCANPEDDGEGQSRDNRLECRCNQLNGDCGYGDASGHRD